MKEIYCDESVWMPVAKGLRQRGWKVKTAHEEGTLGDTDREQLALAKKNENILLTFDDDFLSLVEKEDLEHSGIIYVNQSNKKIGDVVKKSRQISKQESRTKPHRIYLEMFRNPFFGIKHPDSIQARV